jgi:hypothetical protein
VIGERILSGVPGFGEVARSIRYENERWDGGGYPDGLARDQIPLATRIVFACDAYQAMTSDRPYRPAMGQVKARGELRDGAGTQFDPRVAPALLEILGDAAPPPACSPSESCNRARSVELAELAAEIGAHDLFVFRKVADQLYSHLGGRRPGARGGLGISNLTRGQESRLREVIASGVPICVELPQTGRIIGPYYGRSAAIVPCEHRRRRSATPSSVQQHRLHHTLLGSKDNPAIVLWVPHGHNGQPRRRDHARAGASPTLRQRRKQGLADQ